MLPNLYFGGIRIPTFSLCIYIGIIVFVIVTIFLQKNKFGYDRSSIMRMLLLSLAGFVSLGFFAFLLNSLFHSLEEGRLVIGGITWLGGFLGMLPSVYLLLYLFRPEKSDKVITCFNSLMPGLVLAHAIGRVGCFLNGCCYGAETDSILGVEFPRGSFVAMMKPAGYGGVSVKVHPTQLYECFFELLLFMVMLLLMKKLFNYYLALYCVSYSIFRFGLEFLRGDDRGDVGIGLSPSQLMSIILLIIGIVFFVISKKLKGDVKKHGMD